MSAGGQVLHAGAALDEAELAVVLLHGRGSSAEDILSLATHLVHDGVAFLAPSAHGRSWYPRSFMAAAEDNEPHVTAAHETIEDVLAQCVEAGLPVERCGLVGFSQGACLAVDHAARHARRYALIAAYTGGLIGPPGTAFSFPGDLAGTPVFLGANDPDPHVPWARVEASAEVLGSMGATVELERYPGQPHAVNADEVERTARLIAQVLRG